MGTVPKYSVPAHPENVQGTATGTLVGGNICTFAPNLGTQADATAGKDLILFVEEVGESMHNIPVLCGFPAGHGDVNLPLVMGATVTIDVRSSGATLSFGIEGKQQEIQTAALPSLQIPASVRARLAGKREL